jgi:hypothetical protein
MVWKCRTTVPAMHWPLTYSKPTPSVLFFVWSFVLLKK